MLPGFMSSVNDTSTSIDPARELSRAWPPSTSPAVVASVGWINATWWRESGISRSTLCIQLLCDRTSRMPIMRNG